MRKLVLLIVTFGECDEDAEIVLAGHDFDAGSRELGRYLVETSSCDALLGAIDEES